MNERKSVVAVVDDDSRLLESLQDLLESAGYAVRSYQSAESLLASELSDVELLITDIGMPGMDGIELRNLLKAEFPNLPIFLITGRHEIADQRRVHGVSRLFSKPFDGQALLAAVATALTSEQMEENDES